MIYISTKVHQSHSSIPSKRAKC